MTDLWASTYLLSQPEIASTSENMDQLQQLTYEPAAETRNLADVLGTSGVKRGKTKKTSKVSFEKANTTPKVSLDLCMIVRCVGEFLFILQYIVLPPS
ncbi:hypothetical protein ACS0TY_025790 [Phlomoides rotata]